MARIAVGGFMHESNSFVPGHTDYDKYASGTTDRPPLSRGNELFERLSDISCSSAGFFRVAREAGHELVPTVWASTLAGPQVTDDAYERIAGELVGALSRALPVDGVYLDLHGAMVADSFEDGEGELLRRVRAAVGDQVPVVISLDYHCNFTATMARHCDAVCAYQTYPHIDQVETGERAARALNILLARGARTHSEVRKLPFLLPLNFQSTLVAPTSEVIAKVESAESEESGGILSAAYLAGFPPADLFECGPAVVVHGFDAAAVRAAADLLVHDIAVREPEFAEPLYEPAAAVRKALDICTSDDYRRQPVVIADTQDNPGAGGSGDTTGMLEALVAEGAAGAVLGVLCDPQAAQAAHHAGVGATIDLALGGKVPIPQVRPYAARFEVSALGNGQYIANAPGAVGRQMDMGSCALLTVHGVDVVVSSKRIQARERGWLAHLGIDATTRNIIVVKSTCHFRADFEPIAETVLIAIAPGGHIGDPARYPYQRLRPGVRLSPLGAAFGGQS